MSRHRHSRDRITVTSKPDGTIIVVIEPPPDAFLGADRNSGVKRNLDQLQKRLAPGTGAKLFVDIPRNSLSQTGRRRRELQKTSGVEG